MGASSLGALRAVELQPYGMIGIGEIFQMYRHRRLVADDEVALIFSSDDYRPLSEPMVNIRYALSAAKRAGIIDQRCRQIIVRIGKQIYFPDRSWPLLLQEVRPHIPAAILDRLAGFVTEGDFNLKGKDAVRLLTKARRFLQHDKHSHA
jgi:hypothetical protein